MAAAGEHAQQGEGEYVDEETEIEREDDVFGENQGGLEDFHEGAAGAELRYRSNVSAGEALASVEGSEGHGGQDEENTEEEENEEEEEGLESCAGSWDAEDGPESAQDQLYPSEFASIGRYSEETPTALRPFTRPAPVGLSHSPSRSPSSASQGAAVGSASGSDAVPLRSLKKTWREVIEEFGME